MAAAAGTYEALGADECRRHGAGAGADALRTVALLDAVGAEVQFRLGLVQCLVQRLIFGGQKDSALNACACQLVLCACARTSSCTGGEAELRLC